MNEQMPWVTAYLGIGSNIGTDAEKAAVLRALPARLEEGSGGRLRVTGASSLYRTPPWGVTDQPDFFNAVLRLETSLSPRELLVLAKETETELGRTPTFRWGPRVIDIDILLFDRLSVEENGLLIPHPRMLERAFVLEPLLELAPDAMLPDGRRVAEAARSATDVITRVGRFFG